MSSEEGETAFERRQRLARWVALRIKPHEGKVRAWLSRRLPAHEVDEVIQDSYCRIATMESVTQIDRPDGYFFSIARNVALNHLARQRIVQFDAVAHIDSYQDDAATPERIASDRSDLAYVMGLLEKLPERCREIVRLRKIEGWSQKRIAEHFGTTEKAVEKQVWVGVKSIRAAWRTTDLAAEESGHPHDREIGR